MGQGRRKSQRNYNHQRKRSLVLEVDNQENNEVLHFIGTAAILRNRLENKAHAEAQRRDPTPFPVMRDVDKNNSSTTPMEPVPSYKTRSATNTSPTNVHLSSEIPYVQTTENQVSLMKERDEKHTLSYNLVSSLYKDRCIIQNNCCREMTEANRKSISILFDSLFSLLHIHLDFDGRGIQSECDYRKMLQSFFQENSNTVIQYLVHGCRYECVYGLSIHIAMIDLFMSFDYSEMERVSYYRVLFQSLYENLLDLYECERETNGFHLQENSFYVLETSYGQIHRLVELWSSSTNMLFSSYQQWAEEESIFLLLLRCGLLLLQLSSVAFKYSKVLSTTIQKLLLLYPKGISTFLHALSTKLPISSPKKLLSWLELIGDLLENCHFFLCVEYRKEVSLLMKKLFKLASSSHIECSLQTLSIFHNQHVLLNFVLPFPDRLQSFQQCLRVAQNHWNETIREKGEDLFDRMLDYMDY